MLKYWTLVGICVLGVVRLKDLFMGPGASIVKGPDGNTVADLQFQMLEVLSVSPKEAWVLPE